MPGTGTTARVLLKARPTEAQLADRLAAPVPAGLELYLDAEDIAEPARMERLVGRLVELKPRADFVYVVEGPVRSLDGSFFDLRADTDANRECVRRVGWLAHAIGAEAILVHAITPMSLHVPLSGELHSATLRASLPLVERYVKTAERYGVIPLLENIPPVARQREGSFMSTIVGMSARDLAFFCERFPGLRVAVDLSHAGLFLHGLRAQRSTVEPELLPIVEYLASLEDGPGMEEYLDLLEPHLFEAHVSNARGLLGEGLPYGEGDLDLDALTARLAGSVRYLVTEIIEDDPDRGMHMREAQRRMEAVLRAETSRRPNHGGTEGTEEHGGFPLPLAEGQGEGYHDVVAGLRAGHPEGPGRPGGPAETPAPTRSEEATDR